MDEKSYGKLVVYCSIIDSANFGNPLEKNTQSYKNALEELTELVEKYPNLQQAVKDTKNQWFKYFNLKFHQDTLTYKIFGNEGTQT
jgi:hypothetical protein